MTDEYFTEVEIDGEKMLELLHQVVDPRRDYVYAKVSMQTRSGKAKEPGCAYFHEGQPSCLIGHMLAELGFDEDWARNHTIEGTDFAMIAELNDLVRDGKRYQLTPGAIDVANTAQIHQDGMETWGRSLQLAEDEYRTKLNRPEADEDGLYDDYR